MTTTSFNIVETFLNIPFVEASEMTIDLLVQKTVVHNFLRISQSTFPTLPSTVQMESSRSSTQRMTTISSNNVETLLYIPFFNPQIFWLIYWCNCLFSQFFPHSAINVPNATVLNWNGIMPFFYSNNENHFFQHRWNFPLYTSFRSLRNYDWFNGANHCCSQFFQDSAKYVSNATVHSSNRIKPFFHINNDDLLF